MKNQKVIAEVEKIIKQLNLKCTLKQFQDKVNWDYISAHQKLSEDFIREFKNHVSWFWISAHQNLSEDFIREFKDYVNCFGISRDQKLSEDFIREFKDYVSWDYISIHQNLSEDFIREFKDYVNWDCISKYQKLFESFIREFQNKVNWDYISKYQKLSEDFIREFKDKVNWNYVSKYQKLSENFIKEFNLKISRDNWLYKSTEYKKDKLLKTGKYKLNDESYFVGYKRIRVDRYSKFNFQYQYLKDHVYESTADFTDNENSFGLSVNTYDYVKDYHNELIIEVWFKPEDVARIVEDGEKIRVTKFLVKS
jgi:phosphoribosylanthranilate isomerase